MLMVRVTGFSGLAARLESEGRLATLDTLVARRTPATVRGEGNGMGTPADYTILVLLVALGVGLWTLFDRVVQMQRDIEAIKRKLGVSDPPDAN
jgi:hypothetical protein